MRKIFAFLFIIFFFFAACEKDDFCTQNPITPNLILRLYDNTNRNDLKIADNLYVWAEGKDSIFVDTSTDSLYVPLNPAATKTIYNISKGNVINQFTVEYSTENVYVSRSCGFRVIFNNTTFSSNNTWVKDFTPSTLTTIDNQNVAHVQIFH
jgi:hypothetical protein